MIVYLVLYIVYVVQCRLVRCVASNFMAAVRVFDGTVWCGVVWCGVVWQAASRRHFSAGLPEHEVVGLPALSPVRTEP